MIREHFVTTCSIKSCLNCGNLMTLGGGYQVTWYRQALLLIWTMKLIKECGWKSYSPLNLKMVVCRNKFTVWFWIEPHPCYWTSHIWTWYLSPCLLCSSYITIYYIIKVMAFMWYKLFLSWLWGSCDFGNWRSNEEQGTNGLKVKYQNGQYSKYITIQIVYMLCL